ncbi:hypothetical protein J5Y04_25875 [Kitasatospora sp. RG8]|uniref:hypothetical protein n=1 Tax=Kitasatospora sp. RG8 TaxID=2820815 RepID=UPI001AE057C3|nr:hypothetical protein [Kitasatospora sp. RG8]MBP0452948.1 hypothetical protein [Kitasatospora sp. RG8]
MAIPGFHAEASVRPGPGRYATTRYATTRPAAGPHGGATGERIVPMFTEEERQQRIRCSQRLDSCDQDCQPQLDMGDFFQWQRCHDECNQQYDECMQT